jgi:hypothetical protein
LLSGRGALILVVEQPVPACSFNANSVLRNQTGNLFRHSSENVVQLLRRGVVLRSDVSRDVSFAFAAVLAAHEDIH